MSFAAKGILPPEAAFALVLGANLGTAINPVREGMTGCQAARRVPVGNLLNRAIGVVIGLAVLGPLSRLMVVFDPDNARAVADFHTTFNLVLALVTIIAAIVAASFVAVGREARSIIIGRLFVPYQICPLQPSTTLTPNNEPGHQAQRRGVHARLLHAAGKVSGSTV